MKRDEEKETDEEKIWEVEERLKREEERGSNLTDYRERGTVYDVRERVMKEKKGREETGRSERREE